MGQSKGASYQKLDTNSPEQNAFLQQILQMAIPNQQAAAQGFQQFLPGGGGGQAITNQANNNFQQQTLPSILNSFGRGAKASSSLNQALSSGAANLNTDLASQLSQLSLQAAQGLGNLGSQQGATGLSPTFAYQQRQKQMPFYQQLLLGGLNLGGQAAKGYLGGGF